MKNIFILSILLLTAGCANVFVQKYNKDITYPPTKPEDVAVYQRKPEGKAFAEIGEITVDGAAEWREVDNLFKKKAAEIGGDAVYVYSQKDVTRESISPDECYVRSGYYYPYQHFGWRHYRPDYYYPRGYYYCYGYQSTIGTTTFISAVGIVIKYS